MTRLAGLLGLLLALLWAPAFAAATGPQFPELTGRVVDGAHVLSPQTQADLTEKLAALEQKTSRQVVVVTLPTLGGYEIEDYGNQLLRHWGIGQKGLNNGALFIVVPSEHKVRIEVGYGLESTLTDAMSSLILQKAVLPKFSAGDVSGGIVAGTDAIIEQLGLDTSTAEARAADAVQTTHHYHRNPLAGLIPLIIIFFVFSSIFRGRRGGGGGMGWILPLMFLGGGRGGGWGGGGGGDWGGGGFSGGGGSGGGGGASGSW